MSFRSVVDRVPVVYLAGGMKSCWQEEVIARVPGAIFIDPRKHDLRTELEYTAWDLAGVDRADAIFGYLEADNPGGAGLALEFGWGGKAGKHLIFVEEPGHPQSRYFGMVRAVADVYVTAEDTGEPVLLRGIERLQHYVAERKRNFGKSE